MRLVCRDREAEEGSGMRENICKVGGFVSRGELRGQRV
jgi:hypothetical protein